MVCVVIVRLSALAAQLQSCIKFNIDPGQRMIFLNGLLGKISYYCRTSIIQIFIYLDSLLWSFFFHEYLLVAFEIHKNILPIKLSRCPDII